MSNTKVSNKTATIHRTSMSLSQTTYNNNCNSNVAMDNYYTTTKGFNC